jgi:hypothetical protein
MGRSATVGHDKLLIGLASVALSWAPQGGAQKTSERTRGRYGQPSQSRRHLPERAVKDDNSYGRLL